MHDGDGLARALVDLQRLTERLRRDCPWDREQTVRTIVPHTIEEAYEVADAAIGGETGKLEDELGDLLFQTFFLSLLLQEQGEGDLESVARSIHDKLVARHPHVFESPGELRSAGEVKRRWEELKTEQEEREGIFHHVPESLPALLLARKVGQRAAAVGFDYPNAEAALADLDAELAEVREAISVAEGRGPETEPDARVFAELGDVLFAGVNAARRLNVDPELALREATRRFRLRVEAAERLAAGEGRTFANLPLDEQDRLFDVAKEGERA